MFVRLFCSVLFVCFCLSCFALICVVSLYFVCLLLRLFICLCPLFGWEFPTIVNLWQGLPKVKPFPPAKRSSCPSDIPVGLWRRIGTLHLVNELVPFAHPAAGCITHRFLAPRRPRSALHCRSSWGLRVFAFQVGRIWTMRCVLLTSHRQQKNTSCEPGACGPKASSPATLCEVCLRRRLLPTRS